MGRKTTQKLLLVGIVSLAVWACQKEEMPKVEEVAVEEQSVVGNISIDEARALFERKEW